MSEQDKPQHRRCCDKQTRFIWCWDNDQTHAHNLYVCEHCGAVVIERVWDDEGLTVVYTNGVTSP